MNDLDIVDAMGFLANGFFGYTCVTIHSKELQNTKTFHVEVVVWGWCKNEPHGSCRNPK